MTSVQNGMVRKDIMLEGKTVLITGANTGIGLATAIDMAKRKARVIMACRNVQKGDEARKKVVQETSCDPDLVILKKLDLSSFESIREFAADVNETEQQLNVLINNAGVMMCPQSKTKDGFETQFGVNHLGHFLLTNLLLDLLKKSIPSRVVTVSSAAHWRLFESSRVHWDNLNLENNYESSRAYGQSKLMNVLFSRELSKRLKGTGVTCYSLEPGIVDTELARHVGTHENPSFFDRILSLTRYLPMRWFYRTPEQGAQTQIYCAIAPELAEETGKYYGSCTVKTESTAAQSDEDAKKLWEISEKLTGLH